MNRTRKYCLVSDHHRQLLPVQTISLGIVIQWFINTYCAHLRPVLRMVRSPHHLSPSSHDIAQDVSFTVKQQSYPWLVTMIFRTSQKSYLTSWFYLTPPNRASTRNLRNKLKLRNIDNIAIFISVSVGLFNNEHNSYPWCKMNVNRPLYCSWVTLFTSVVKRYIYFYYVHDRSPVFLCVSVYITS
jgi:hypothetical protein